MFRIALCSVLIVSALANRIRHDGVVAVAKSRTKIGATCEDLQASFHSRVAGLQTLVEAHPDPSTFSRVTQARFYMRTVGLARTFNRARSCSWLVDGDGDDITRVRELVQIMLTSNPCAEAARAEMGAELSQNETPDDLQAMQVVLRAASVLNSETCDANTLSLDEDALAAEDVTQDEAGLEAEILEGEAQAQDAADELMETAIGEESSGAFVELESDKVVSMGIMRSIGLAFIFIGVVLGCASTAVLILTIISFMFPFMFMFLMNGWIPQYSPREALAALAAVPGFGLCGASIFQSFLLDN